METKGQTQGQGTSETSAFGGASGGAGVDQFTNWLKTADDQQLARALRPALAKIGTMGISPTTRDVFSREFRDEPDVLTGIRHLSELAGLPVA